MRGWLLVGALLFGTSTMSPAVEVQMDEHTLCPVDLRAFDEKDSPAIEEFFRFVQSVFNELSTRDIDREKTASRAKLTDRCHSACKIDPLMECALRAGQD